MRSPILRLSWIWLGLTLTACLSRPPVPASTPTLPPPVVSLVTITPTPLPTSTRIPSLAPLTRTSTPFAPTPLPTPTSDPADFPENVNPLTGEVVSDPAVLDYRPLAVKVVNEPPCARPQFGLNRAALVFEHYVEAWGTRFTAIYYGVEVDRIGAVRSARLIDLELPAIFDAILVTSGSSGGVKQRLLASDFAGRIISAEFGATCPPLCRVPVETVACADLEHTLFTNTRALHTQAAKSGLEQRPSLSGWAFSAAPPAEGVTASKVRIGYRNAPADWTFDEAGGNYLRSQNGNRQVDAQTGLRLTAANVVVLFANHLFTDIRESSNFYSLEIQFWSEGRALLFRDGRAFEGKWLRPTRPGLYQLAEASGQPLPLKPGRTWFEFVPLDSPAEAAAGQWTITAPILPQQTPP